LVIGNFELTGDLARDSLEMIGLAGDSTKVGGLGGEIIGGLIGEKMGGLVGEKIGDLVGEIIGGLVGEKMGGLGRDLLTIGDL
jgi:outer membrane lipoprotein SlyB